MYIQNINAKNRNIPSEDFVSESFDKIQVDTTEKILIVFSTPRSGSTYLCDLLYKNDFCLAHEYLQPYQYLPILAKRWDCITENRVNDQKYFEQLCRFRTNHNKWLGINVHGSHIENLKSIEKFYSNIEVFYIYLYRRDIFAQAISFDLASQTEKWSSNFSSLRIPEYSFERIQKQLEKIHVQNNLIKSYLFKKQINACVLTYEDMIQCDQKSYFYKKLSNYINHSMDEKVTASIKKQSNDINVEWTHKFIDEYEALYRDYFHNKKKSLYQRIKSIVQKENLI